MVFSLLVQIGLNFCEYANSLEYSTIRMLPDVPEMNGRCRDWQLKYLSSMKTLEPNSSLVYHSVGGLSDSLTGMVSSFLISYALRRHFYLSHDNVLWSAIDSKVIKSAESQNIFEFERGAIKYQLHKKTGINLIMRLSKIQKQEIHLTGNRGSVYKIINSKVFESFDSLQLRAVDNEIAFGCLMNLLASPTNSTLQKFSTELMKLQRKDSYKIGLQIRTFETLRGFKERTGEEYLKKYRIYVDCVKILAKNKRNVLIYVISDSGVLRQTFVRHFKIHGYDSFTSSVGMSSILAPWWHSTKKEETGRRRAKEIGPAEAAFGESYLYSLSDVYVFTKKSGFGRVGAASGMHIASYFPVGRNSITSASMCGKRGFSMSHIEHDSAGL